MKDHGKLRDNSSEKNGQTEKGILELLRKSEDWDKTVKASEISRRQEHQRRKSNYHRDLKI